HRVGALLQIARAHVDVDDRGVHVLPRLERAVEEAHWSALGLKRQPAQPGAEALDGNPFHSGGSGETIFQGAAALRAGRPEILREQERQQLHRHSARRSFSKSGNSARAAASTSAALFFDAAACWAANDDSSSTGSR